MKKLLKTLLLGFFVLILIVISSLTTLWLHPNLILREAWIKKVANAQTFVTFPDGFPADFKLSLQNERIFSQAILIQSGPFCAEVKSIGIDACFRVFHIEGTVRLKKKGLGIEKIGPIELELKNARYSPFRSAKKEDPKKSGPSRFSVFLIPNFKLSPVRLVLDEGVMKLNGEKADGIFRFSGRTSLIDSVSNQTKLDFKTDWKAELPFTPKKVALRGDGNVSLNQDLIANLTIDAPKTKTDLGAKLDLGAKFNLKTLEGDLDGKGQLNGIVPLLPVIKVEEFHIRRRGSLDFRAKVHGDLAIGAPVSKYRHAMPAPRFQTRARAAIEGTQNADGEWKLGLELDPIKQYGMVLGANLRAVLGKEGLQFEQVKVDLDIAEFGETVTGLSRTQFAVLAPFNSLRGRIHLQVRDPDSVKGGLPLHFETKLSSNLQRLNTYADGILKLSKKNVPERLEAKIVLDDVELQAPELNPVVALPKVSGDSRILTPSITPVVDPVKEAEKKVEAKAEGKNSFPWALDIQSGSQPIRILYDLFHPNAPFTLKARVSSDSPANFALEFQPLTIQYLSRKASVDYLRVNIEKELLFDGRLSIKRSDCTIIALLKKKGEQTEFQLTSEPAFDEDNIISMLLFNERAADLDDSSKRSVEDTRMAISRKSLGFFSFFVLASTPVESVAYDPTTKVYSARVRLPGGVSATVGSDWDKTQEVGLMKRLGGKWVLSVQSITDAEGGSSHQESMIEWWNRY